jgi:hypothetical protein
MQFGGFVFGSIQIDGTRYDHDVVIDRGKICRRKKKGSKKFREALGHTPLSLEEDIPWKCRRLVVGTGISGAMPVVDELKRTAEHRGITLVILPTQAAIDLIQRDSEATNAVLHVTC